MIKESKLIGTKLSMPYGWHEFTPLDLFEVNRGVRITTSNREPGNIPLVTAGNEHTGISDYINNPEQKLFNKSGIAITIDMFGNCFTRNYSFKADDNIIVLTNLEFSEQTMLFLGSVLQKLTYAQFNYGAQFRLNVLKSLKMSLPVTQDGQPDYDWMSSYIRELENQRIRELENQRIRELETYLQVTGLSDNILSDEEKIVLEQWRQHEKFGGGTLVTKRFLVPQLFDVSRGDISNQNLLVESNSGMPLVLQNDTNNGVDGRRFIHKGRVFGANSIVVGRQTGVMYTIPYDFITTDGVLVLTYEDASELSNLFIISLLKSTMSRYGFTNTVSAKKLNDLFIELPVTADGTPDYEFMETFIIAQEKLAVQRLSEFRKEQIAETKALTRP